MDLELWKKVKKDKKLTIEEMQKFTYELPSV